MKKIEIIIRREKVDEVKTKLYQMGATGIMLSNIAGYGQDSTIQRTANYARIGESNLNSGVGARIAGIVGYIERTSILYSHNNGEVQGGFAIRRYYRKCKLSL